MTPVARRYIHTPHINVCTVDILFLYRPISAPSIPPELSPLPPSPPSQQAVKGDTHKVVRTYTMPGGRPAPSTTSRTPHRELPRVSYIYIACLLLYLMMWCVQSRTVPKLPPIHQRGFPGRGRSSSFHVPTLTEVRESQRQRDRRLIQHSESNPHCACQLCIAGGATQGQELYIH